MSLVFVGLTPQQVEQPPDILTNFMRWDSGWYEQIINQGYTWKGPDQQSSVAFFPLYPLTAKIMSFFLFGNVKLALFVTSNLAFLFFLHYLYKLTCHEFGAETAERALLYAALFPIAFYSSAGYTESLMLFLATATLYYARLGQWRAALIFGALTPLTRLVGMAVFPALAWEWYKQKGLTFKALYLLTIPSGLLMFMIYLWILTGDPLAFNTVQKAWNHVLTWPWGTFQIAWQVLTTVPRTRYIYAIAALDFGSMGLFLILCVAALRYLPPAYWLYSLPVYFLSTSATLLPDKGLPTASIARYMMSIFPAFMLLGHWGKNKFLHYLIMFLWAILTGPLLVYYFAGIWVE